jgi:CRISPR-associated endonuclease/helicase Cas3
MQDVSKVTEKVYIGHKDQNTDRQQLLIEHLHNVGDICARFVSAFGEYNIGKRIGDYHDIGKYSREFQDYIQAGGGRKYDHSTAGTKEFCYAQMIPAAFCVAGHHGGLPDCGTKMDGAQEGTLMGKLKRNIPNYQEYQDEIPKVSALKNICHTNLYKKVCKSDTKFETMMYIRMLFSCLVDADFLDTEYFMSNGTIHRDGFDSIEMIKENFDKYVTKFFVPTDKIINKKRSELLSQCLTAGDTCNNTLFNLTIPTGGGKTISSMAFALHYAVRLHKQRIIYVIPFTSIIEQNANVFESIVGEKNVVEHHMNVDYDDENESEDSKRLATENWDAPIIVTTNVQFFESLFHNKPSKCRKLHNIANSVIIFDEAQMIPNDVLRPCLKTIDDLTMHYGCAAVLCTATQPSLEKFFIDRNITEICEHIDENYKFFKRTMIEVMKETISVECLVQKLTTYKQVLCIVNTKNTAQKIYESLSGDGIYHLSTNMYPKHRKDILSSIQNRLKKNERCIVISTSLIEAGVDISFPCVYREMTGLDSIIQAAGRCNREGNRTVEQSKVFVFSFNQSEIRVARYVRQFSEATETICHRYSNDISVPEAIREYFNIIHTLKGEQLDYKDILKLIQDEPYPFEQVARKFKMIESKTTPVLIPRDETASKIVEQLRQGKRSRSLMRKAGMYSVNVYYGNENAPYEILYQNGQIEKLDEGISILIDESAYDCMEGLIVNRENGKGVFL